MSKIHRALWVVALLVMGGCHKNGTDANIARVSGQVEAVEVQVAPDVGGRIVELPINEGDRLKQGDLVARLDTRDIDLALRRAQADRPGPASLEQ